MSSNPRPRRRRRHRTIACARRCRPRSPVRRRSATAGRRRWCRCRCRPGARGPDVIQQPVRLGGGEHRVERQAAPRRMVAPCPPGSLSAQACGALILPGQHRRQRRAGAAVPDHAGFALRAEARRRRPRPGRSAIEAWRRRAARWPRSPRRPARPSPAAGSSMETGAWPRATIAPRASTSRHLVALVPWSMARTSAGHVSAPSAPAPPPRCLAVQAEMSNRNSVEPVGAKPHAEHAHRDRARGARRVRRPPRRGRPRHRLPRR